MRAARRILPSDADAEDAAQEALARGWGRRATCREPERYLAWLAQIARHEALRLSTARISDEFDESLHPSGGEDDLEPLLSQLDFDHALARLDAEDRALLHLRYVEDLTYRQIAEVLGMPVGTAKVRLHRLRARLRARLAVSNAP